MPYYRAKTADVDFPEEADALDITAFGVIAGVDVGKPAVIIRFNGTATDELVVEPGTIRTIGRPSSRGIKSFAVKSTGVASAINLEFVETDLLDNIIALATGPEGAAGADGADGADGPAGPTFQATLKMGGGAQLAPQPNEVIKFNTIVGTDGLTVSTANGDEGRITIPADTALNLAAFVEAVASDATTSSITFQVREVSAAGVNVGLYGDPVVCDVPNTNGDASTSVIQGHIRETLVGGVGAPKYYVLEIIALTSITSITTNTRAQLG